jgi:hypothetical protein
MHLAAMVMPQALKSARIEIEEEDDQGRKVCRQGGTGIHIDCEP